MKSKVVFAVLSTLVLLSSNQTLADNIAAERWFEVELIVFSQADSSNLKEQFNEAVKPIRLGNSIDLVTAYYQPDIEPMLHSLENCSGTTDTPEQFLPAALRNWQQWQVPFYPLFCLSEPVMPAWYSNHLFRQRQLDTTLPMPARLPVRLAAKNDNHQAVPYLAPESAFQLTELASKISRQPNKQLMLHTVWRQAPVTEQLAVPSRWFAGEDYSELVDYWGQQRNEIIDPVSEQTVTNAFQTAAQDELFDAIDTLLAQLNAAGKLESLDSNEQELRQNSDNLSNLPADIWQLDGLFKLHLDHYLFVNTEFNLRRPATDKPLNSINIKQRRRVISGEVHYLDHPQLGMVLQIRRFEVPLTDADDEAENVPEQADQAAVSAANND
mgnify:CR=1 FL=1|tara:strand:+ start:2511 stop:3659 length:1149 start_codon:yes stop_codon:yes gene_type:complete